MLNLIKWPAWSLGTKRMPEIGFVDKCTCMPGIGYVDKAYAKNRLC